ncbi:MAG: two-component regulator propeller domain-containing protein [Calditrichia bacterium]
MFDYTSNKFTAYKNDSNDPNSINDNFIFSINEDRSGLIWVGTNLGGISYFNPATQAFEHYKHDPNNNNSLSDNIVLSMLVDQKGYYWIGTRNGGLNKLVYHTKKFTHYLHNPSNPKSLISNSIQTLLEDQSGTIWIGSYSSGLDAFDPKSNIFTHYTNDPANSSTITDNRIYALAEDKSGIIWIGTYGGGLNRLDKKTGKISNTYPPPISFTGYTRFNTDDEEGKPIIEKGISVRDSIFLTYKDNIITFDFAGLSFFNNFENQYKYKLEGFNDTWIQLGNNHSVAFTNLSPGEYNLRVIGSNNDGVWNETGTSLTIFVSPPWWKTKIAYAFYFVVFFSLLFGLRRFEINRREQKAQIRESALQIKATEAEKRALEIENERKTKELEEARQLHGFWRCDRTWSSGRHDGHANERILYFRFIQTRT